MSDKIILKADEKYTELDKYLEESGEKSVFLVSGNSIKHQEGLYKYFGTLEKRLGIKVVRFSNFQPNPLYESVVEGVEKFKESGSNLIIAVGGGSAMDVAKCIKLYSNMDPTQNYLKQEAKANDVKLLAIPTTAGTGSEATRFAVIYYEGAKQSVNDLSIIPSAVLFDPTTLDTLPDYQRKATLLDALSHSIESFWSVNSTPESKGYSREAIKLILDNMDRYLAGDNCVNENMSKAAYFAGKAINITQTTAGHAMCYKLTSLYHIAHGHAAALVNCKLWPWMIKNTEKCIDGRGKEYLDQTFAELAACFGEKTAEGGANRYNKIVSNMGLSHPEGATDEEYEMLRTSVNPVRLKNNPVRLDGESIDHLYHRILAR